MSLRHTIRPHLGTALLGWILIGLFAVLASTQGGAQPGGPSGLYEPYVPGEVLIKFKDEVSPDDRVRVRARVGGEKLRQFRSGGEQLRLRSLDTETAIALLRGAAELEYVEPNYVLSLDATPTDPRYPELYGLNNTGQTGGTPGADIDAERAWSVSTGSHAVTVAVIDTGVDYNHPDLAANTWINPGEIAGNGIDDDANGYVDDVRGWDFANGDNNPFDDNGHGTHVSGTIGAVANNGIGVAGVNWNVTIVPVKFLSGGGSGSTANAILSIDYATALGVDVMSNSWGGGGFSQAMLDSINAAAAAEVVFVAAAGNSGSNNDVSPHYPSNYNAPNVIAVMATDHNDARSIWPSGNSSSYGATTVDIAAPGTNILSTTPGNSYASYSGTSMATPHVSGAAALLRAVSPELPAVQVRQILMDMGDDIPALAGLCVSGARLNAFFPIAEPDDVPPGAIDDLATTTATSNSLFVSWTATGDDGEVGTASGYDLRYATSPIVDEAGFAGATQAQGEPVPGAPGAPQSMEIAGLDPATTYFFAVKATDEWGNRGPLGNVASGTTLPPPTVATSVSPDPLEFHLLTGQTASGTLTVTNTGVGTLDWRIPIPTVSGPTQTLHDALTLEKGEADPRVGDPVVNGFGGPDAFGYRWADSDEPGGPTFTWNDIALTGTVITELNGDDQISEAIPLGFNFSMYGNVYDSLRVSTNGWVSFTSTVASGSASYGNQQLPTAGGPENLLAAFWDDLHFRSGTRAVYTTDGSRFIVQYTNVDRYTTGSNLTFQIEIRNTGEIFFRYLDVAGVVNDCTVGIQNDTKTDGLTVAFNTGYLHDELEVRIAAVPQWLTASPTSGRLFGSESAAVALGIDAAGLDGGTYEGTVHVESNDPLRPVVPHTVMLYVTGAPSIAVSPAWLDFGQVYAGFSKSLTLQVNNTGTDTLTVSSITSGDPQVTVSPSSFSVPAHAGQPVTVTYAPTAPGTLASSLTILSNASNTPSLTVDTIGYSLPPPGMLVDPTSYNETLYTGGTVTRNLRITNSGGSDLNVNLSVDLGSLTGDEEQGEIGIDRTGGPDSFGYRYRDSDEPGGPTFSWLDISSIGTPLSISGDDQNSGAFSLPFPFPFYGNTFTSARVCTNGWLSFTNAGTARANATLPTGGTSQPENMLAAWWDDLHFRSVQRARTYNDGGNRFIVQFTDVDTFSPTGSHLTFQIVLYPSGRIVYQYLTMSGTLTSATIGIQNATRSVGLTVNHNAGGYIHNNMAIEFFRVPDWLAVTPTSGTIPPGEYRDFDVIFNAGDSGDRVFNGNVRIATNIPDPALQLVPATLNVLGVADVATEPTSFDYGTRFVGYPHVTELAVRNVGTATLNVLSVTSNDPALTVEEPLTNAIFPVLPGGQIVYHLRWLPTAPGPLAATVTVESDDPDEPVLSVPVTGNAIPPPVLGYAPGSFNDHLFVGETTSPGEHTLTLTNTGGSDLTWSLGVRLTDATVVPVETPELEKGEEPKEHSDQQVLGFGGPDMFGYRWKDSDSPGGPTFQWFDISSIGTPLPMTGDDLNNGPVSIGFGFPFYGTTYSSVRVCTNGWLSFTSTSTSLSNATLPTGGTSSPNNLLAAFWDDLDFRSAQRARTYSDGTRFIVQWTGVDHHSAVGAGNYTFQIVLYPSGKIVYQYLTMSGLLNSATIGIQNGTRTDGLTVAHNHTSYMHDNLAIQFIPIAEWLRVSSGSGTVPPGGSAQIDVTFDATELIGGTYTGGLTLVTNDPAAALVDLPATLQVTGFPAIVAAPASLDFGMVYVGLSATQNVTISNPGSDVLHVTGIAVTGDYATDTTPFSLAVGASRTLAVTYTPTTDGPRPGSIVFTSNATGVPELTVPLSGTALFPPVAGVDPASIVAAAPPGGTKVKQLELCNTGGSDLTWTAATNVFTEPPPPPAPPPDEEIEKGDTSRDGTGLAVERTGGPDAFGYRFADSDEPGGPAFDWLDISTIGTPIPTGTSGDDVNVAGLPIGFPFSFYGNSFTTVNVCTNGWLSFTSTATSLTNTALPTGGTLLPNNMMAPFWDDLDFNGGTKAHYYNDGGTRFIVQWTNVEHYPSGSSYTFQVVLYPDGRFRYQYLTLSGTLNSHTVGMQNGDRSIGLTLAHNQATPYLHDAMAIEFSKIPDWLQVEPTSGAVAAGACVDLTLTMNAAGIEDGDHQGSIVISNNDPFNSVITVPVLLHVGEVGLTYVDIEPNTLNLGSNGNYVNATIQLPLPYDPHDVDLSTVCVFDGQLCALPGLEQYTDVNLDGILELAVKFDRAAFQALCPEGDAVTIEITGEVTDVTWFTGTDVIRAMRPQVTHPNGAEYLTGGASVTLTWAPPAQAAETYTVWLSRDGGQSWEELATGLTGTSYPWTVSGPATERARIRVFALDSRGVMGDDASDADFSIAAALLPPGAPENLTVTVSGTDLLLDWKRPLTDLQHGPVDHYRILRATSPQGPFTEIGAPTGESFVDPIAATGADAAVFYRVTALNAAGETD